MDIGPTTTSTTSSENPGRTKGTVSRWKTRPAPPLPHRRVLGLDERPRCLRLRKNRRLPLGLNRRDEANMISVPNGAMSVGATAGSSTPRGAKKWVAEYDTQPPL